jgi:hypothetical protein
MVSAIFAISRCAVACRNLSCSLSLDPWDSVVVRKEKHCGEGLRSCLWKVEELTRSRMTLELNQFCPFLTVCAVSCNVRVKGSMFVQG